MFWIWRFQIYYWGHLLNINQEFYWQQQFSSHRASNVLWLLWRIRWVIIPPSTPLYMSPPRKILSAGFSTTTRIFFLIELNPRSSQRILSQYENLHLVTVEDWWFSQRIYNLHEKKNHSSFADSLSQRQSSYW